MTKKDITLHEATQAYLDYLQELGKHPRTLYTYSKDLEQMEAFFGPNRLLSSIHNLHVGKFLKSDELLKLPNGENRAVPTVSKTIRVLRMFFIWAEKTDLIEKAPLPKGLPLGRDVEKET